MQIAADSALSLKAKLFRGLSDSSRLMILELLRTGQLSVSQIVERTGLSQPNVSQHLACLKDCGLVVSRQEGRSIIYSLADERMEDIFMATEDILARIGQRMYSCTRYGDE